MSDLSDEKVSGSDVRRIFFLTEDEAKAKRDETGDSFITHRGPHFELMDGSFIYCRLGFPASGEMWW